jgi:hypothetical protein
VYSVPGGIFEREARESCKLLGLRLEHLTIDVVKQAYRDWQRTLPPIDEFGKHSFSDLDEMRLMKQKGEALRTLYIWVKENPSAGDDPQPSGVPRKPSPLSGTNGIALPLPDPDGEPD